MLSHFLLLLLAPPLARLPLLHHAFGHGGSPQSRLCNNLRQGIPSNGVRGCLCDTPLRLCPLRSSPLPFLSGTCGCGRYERVKLEVCIPLYGRKTRQSTSSIIIKHISQHAASKHLARCSSSAPADPPCRRVGSSPIDWGGSC